MYQFKTTQKLNISINEAWSFLSNPKNLKDITPEYMRFDIISGDDKYQSIAAASILAKVYHDNFIDDLVNENPELEKYNWTSNMCYGTAEHINAIKEHGITPYHRKSFGPCK